MKKTDCWIEAYKFIANGDEHRAIEICTGELCSDILECQNYLGWSYYKNGDMQQAVQWFSRAAERGDANASYGIACVYYAEGEYEKALEHFKYAAEKGCTRAFHWIGYVYHKGVGVPVDLDLAADFYKKGASNGFLIAEHALIRLAFRAPGVFQKICILPKYIFLIFKTAFVSRDVNNFRFSDFLVLGPSINHNTQATNGFRESNE